MAGELTDGLATRKGRENVRYRLTELKDWNGLARDPHSAGFEQSEVQKKKAATRKQRPSNTYRRPSILSSRLLILSTAVSLLDSKYHETSFEWKRDKNE